MDKNSVIPTEKLKVIEVETVIYDADDPIGFRLVPIGYMFVNDIGYYKGETVLDYIGFISLN